MAHKTNRKMRHCRQLLLLQDSCASVLLKAKFHSAENEQNSPIDGFVMTGRQQWIAFVGFTHLINQFR